jgi:hypothetical protein
MTRVARREVRDGQGYPQGGRPRVGALAGFELPIAR